MDTNISQIQGDVEAHEPTEPIAAPPPPEDIEPEPITLTLLPHHIEDLKSSGISDEIISLNFRSIEDSTEVKKLINWRSNSRWKHPDSLVPCWAVSGVTPGDGEPTGLGVQIKPDVPPADPETDKPRKYLSAHEQDSYPLFLCAPEVKWNEIIQNPAIDLVIAEGAKKAACLLSLGQAAIHLPGVTNGQKRGRLHQSLEPFAQIGRSVYIAFDADWQTNRNVRLAILGLGRLLKAKGVVVYVPCWDGAKGIDDYLTGFPEAERAGEWSRIKDSAPTLEEWLIEAQKLDAKAIEQKNSRPPQTENGATWLSGWDDRKGKPELLPSSQVARILREEYQPTLAWNVETGSFFRYEGDENLKGVWVEEPEDFIYGMIQAELDARGAADLYGSGYISSIYRLLRGYLPVRHWDEAIGLLPMQNGVLDLQTRQLLPHQPGYRFTWQLPYEYNPAAKCDLVQEWLLEAQEDDPQRVELLRAYLKAIVLGRVDLQRFVELLGKGGTGKGTYTRLAIALVGLRNTFITDLRNLENNRFETAAIKGKRLIVITDADRYAGSVNVLKAITGQDPLRNERKGQQQRDGFTSGAMVVIAANESIASTDYTSGLERRRLTIPFMKQVAPGDRRDLLTINHAGMSGEFVEFLPGVLNWVLEMPDQEMRRLILNTSIAVPSLSDWRAESLMANNPLAEWLNYNCVHSPQIRTQVGIAKRIRCTSTTGDIGSSSSKSWDAWEKQDEWLYANYVAYCAEVGNKPISVRRFSGLLEDLCNGQLKLPVSHGRDRDGSFIQGLRLRTAADESIPELVLLSLGAVVMDCDSSVMDCDGTVTAETRTGDKCDRCDGFSKSSSEIENQDHQQQAKACPNVVDNSVSEKRDGISKKPSQPSHPSQARVSAVTEPSQRGDRSITVGQRVKVTRINGKTVHGWSGVVQSIDGGKAQVLLVGEKYPNEFDLSVLAPHNPG